MKHRALFAAILALVLLGLTACGKKNTAPERIFQIGEVSDIVTNTEPGISLSILASDASSATYRIVNETGRDLFTDHMQVYALQVRQDGAWHFIDIGPRASTSEAYRVKDGETRDVETSWEADYGVLPAGTYRLVKSFFTFTIHDKFILSAEFTVG
ncbi:MAG: hypothetical protein IKO91_07405 [Oscillospiraceae bacterium]|nr:hypothetical protein [Oscillospiraceae bacterium]